MSDAPNQSAHETLHLPDGRRLAYVRVDAADGDVRPTVAFLGGFQSDMTGSKATALEDWARATGRGFLRFDYTGHGASSGDFEDGCIGDWTRDALDMLTATTEGRLILVGSSMGGWISLLAAGQLARAGRPPVGLVGLAAAPDFTEDLMWARFDEDRRSELRVEGVIRIHNPYEPSNPTPITMKLIEDGRRNLVLRTPLRLACPVRLIHGSADIDVPQDVALRLIDHLDSPDARLTLIKGADHRLSEPGDIELLIETLEGLA